MTVDRRFRGAYCLLKRRSTIPEDNSEHHTRRRENLKSHKTEELGEKPDPVPLRPPQIPQGLTWA
jgi:hypothetical protein